MRSKNELSANPWIYLMVIFSALAIASVVVPACDDGGCTDIDCLGEDADDERCEEAVDCSEECEAEESNCSEECVDDDFLCLEECDDSLCIPECEDENSGPDFGANCSGGSNSSASSSASSSSGGSSASSSSGGSSASSSSGGSSASSSSGGGSVEVLPQAGGSFVAVSRFDSTAAAECPDPPSDCPCEFEHYHDGNATRAVLKCDGTSGGNPNGTTCGYGTVNDVILVSSCAFQ